MQPILVAYSAVHLQQRAFMHFPHKLLLCCTAAPAIHCSCDQSSNVDTASEQSLASTRAVSACCQQHMFACCHRSVACALSRIHDHCPAADDPNSRCCFNIPGP